MNKVIKIYKISIVTSIIIILLSAIQLFLNLVEMPRELPMSVCIFTSIGLISFIIDKRDYIKNNTFINSLEKENGIYDRERS